MQELSEKKSELLLLLFIWSGGSWNLFENDRKITIAQINIKLILAVIVGESLCQG